jgi:hypothetical protein
MKTSRRAVLRGLGSAALLERLALSAASERLVAVAGSENRGAFAVIDFTNLLSPASSYVDPGFGAGVRVALGADAVAAGSVLSGAIRWIDLSNSTVTLRGTYQTSFSGIGAIAVRGSLAAAAESVNTYKARIALIDFANPNAPALVSLVQTPFISASTSPGSALTAITNIVFLSDRIVLASGANDFRVVVVDFSASGSPVVSTFLPKTGGPPVIHADSAKSLIAAGDSGGRLVKFFSGTTFTEIGSAATSLASVNSLALSSVGFALASSSYNFTLDRVDPLSLISQEFTPKLGGGLIAAASGPIGACAEINGSRVALLNAGAATPAVLGVADSGLPSISTLAVGSVSLAAKNAPAHLLYTPSAIAFPPTLLSSQATLTFRNTGGSAALQIRGIRCSDSHFSAAANSLDVPAAGIETLRLKFAAPAGHGSYHGTLLFSTNDPQAPHVSIALSATIGVH